MIANYMDLPQQCKHKIMLEDKVARLFVCAMKGLKNRSLKGKSHIGCWELRKLELVTAATVPSKSSRYAQLAMKACKVSTGQNR